MDRNIFLCVHNQGWIEIISYRERKIELKGDRKIYIERESVCVCVCVWMRVKEWRGEGNSKV